MKRLTPATVDALVLTKLHAKSPQLQKESWDYTGGYARRFKDAITSQMAIAQSKRCAYCGSRLLGEEHHRDHIAPKESHPEFTFIPSNLVLACYYCNSECKGTTDTISIKSADYSNCSFRIIHPIIDEPSDHIQFTGGEKQILVQVVAGSAKGTATVTMFRLDSPELTKQRAKDADYDDDLEHLPGNWKDGFICAATVKLKMKVR